MYRTTGYENDPHKSNEGAESVWVQAGSDLSAFIGDPATGAQISFKADPHFDATAVAVYSQTLEAQVPVDLAGSGALVTDEEVKDILSGFTPDDEPDRAAGPTGPTGDLPDNLAVILDIELVATARLGKVDVPISEILALGPGSIIEVGHLVDEPVDLLVNDKLIARGEVVVVDERFGLRITEIISQQERIESLR